MVVWIEIPMPGTAFRSTPSPPAWWCGLKSDCTDPSEYRKDVTTCVVVWIEICLYATIICGLIVTTCVVVWIEIDCYFKP